MVKQSKLTSDEVRERHKELNAWALEDGSKLSKEFSFKNFKEALAFTNRVGEIAENLKHHPDIYLTWGKVSISIQTHEADGLTEKDFQLATEIDKLTSSE